MFNYEKTKEMLELAKKLGPEYEVLVKWNMSSRMPLDSNKKE